MNAIHQGAPAPAIFTFHTSAVRVIVSESGMYACVLKSRKLEAKPFRKWVTAEVLPEIRKTGRARGSA